MHKGDNFFIDYETYWGTKYSLRTQGMSYTDFILDEQFQEHGASVAINKETPVWLQGEDLHDAIAEAERHAMMFIAHNVPFDGILTTIYHKIQFARYFCTLAMVRAMYQGGVGAGLDECMKVLLGWDSGKTDIISKLKDIRTEDIPEQEMRDLITYADKDLAGTQELYYRYAPHLPEMEHEIMDIILRMFCNPRLIFNEAVLLEAVKEADDDREKRVSGALKIITEDPRVGDISTENAIKLLKGTKTFPDYLRESHNFDVPMKKNPKGKLIPALAKTDKGFQEMLESKDDTIRLLTEGRLAVKSTQAQTRAYRFKKLHEELGYFPVAYNYAGAHTWRVSGANKINPANLKRGSKLRTCIEAPEGYVLGVADASQIECRGNLYIAGQESGLQIFRDGRDPYNETAGDIFGRVVDRKGNPDDFFEGFLGKTATLGLGFGMGGPKFKVTVDRDAKVNLGMDLDFDINEANRIVYDVYRPKNYKVVEMWKHCEEFLFAMLNDKSVYWDYGDDSLWIDGKNNKIFFPNGTWLYYPCLDYSEGSFTYLVRQGKSGYKTKYIYGALLDENIVQKFARDITSYHMVQIAERFRVVMHTYDENIALLPIDSADEDLAWMIETMKKPPKWAATIPLDAEGGWAKEYSK